MLKGTYKYSYRKSRENVEYIRIWGLGSLCLLPIQSKNSETKKKKKIKVAKMQSLSCKTGRGDTSWNNTELDDLRMIDKIVMT